jgi:hypothetical protein
MIGRGLYRNIDIPICAEKQYFDILQKLSKEIDREVMGGSFIEEYVDNYVNYAYFEYSNYQFPEIYTGTYELICWMLDNKMKVDCNYRTLSILTGGGYQLFFDKELKSRQRKTGRDFVGKLFNFRDVGSDRFLQLYNSKKTYNISDRFCDDYKYITISAVEANNIDILKFLREENILDENALIATALAYNNINIIKKFSDILRVSAVDHILSKSKINSLSVNTVKYLCSMGYELSQCSYYLVVNDIEAIKFLFQTGIKWPKYISSEMSENGNIEILSWCLEKGCVLEETAINYSKTLKMFKYLETKGLIPVLENFYHFPTLDIIKHYISKKYKITEKLITWLDMRGSNKIKKWIKKHRNKLEIMI